MNEALTIAAISGGILLYGLISGRLQKTIITAPMVIVILGISIGTQGLGLIDFAIEHTFVDIVAEITLILVLFADASRISLKRLSKQHVIPTRLLAIGLPLTMIAGTLAGMLIFNTITIWSLIILAVILAPTDAALGQAVVSSPKVPIRIRQAINVESGLNDGIALPFLLFFMSMAGEMEGTNPGY